MQTNLFFKDFEDEIVSPFDNDTNINDVLKYVKFVSSGNKNNIFNSVKPSELSISAIKSTTYYNSKVGHKLNITK